MKKIKHLALVMVAAMTIPYCKAVEGWDCDGTTQENCHPFVDHIYTDPTTGDSIYSSEGPGGADIQKCTSSNQDQGNCKDDGLIQCNYAAYAQDLTTGQVLGSGTYPGGAETYSCS